MADSPDNQTPRLKKKIGESDQALARLEEMLAEELTVAGRKIKAEKPAAVGPSVGEPVSSIRRLKNGETISADHKTGTASPKQGPAERKAGLAAVEPDSAALRKTAANGQRRSGTGRPATAPPAKPEKEADDKTEEHIELIDLSEVVEIERLTVPPPAKSMPRWADPSFGAASKALSESAQTHTTPTAQYQPAAELKKKGFSALHGALQAFIMLFVLSWVFILGVLIGRGHLWESGLGHDLVVWLEKKAGWQADVSPEIVLQENSLTRFPYDPSQKSPSLKHTPFDDLVVTEEYVGEDGRIITSEAETPEIPRPRGNGRANTLPPPAAEADRGLATAGDVNRNQVRPAAPSIGAKPPPAALAMLGENEGLYAVQVVMVFDEAEAQQRVERLQQQGFTSYFYKNSNGRFPVRVGRFNTQEEAEAAKNRLESLGYTRPYISVLGN